MVGRSLKASQQGIQLAKQALIRKRLKRKDLIGFVCQSRQPISKFFTGKPGSGKTTFLQWVAIKCDLGEFQPNRVPIFIRLKNFAEDAKAFWAQSLAPLQDYINEEFVSCKITDKSVIETILIQGKTLILLDGLDEVLEEDNDEIIKHIRRFVEKYFKNNFIITCRIAAQKYRFVREGFSDAEVADFDDKQVELFAKKWFTVARNNPKAGEATARRFIEKLNLPENQQISKLAVTPILLNLTPEALELVEELEEMSKSDKFNKIFSYGIILLLHLIRKVAENRTTKSWQVSIFNSVKQIQRTNRRHKAKGTYLTEDELRETLQDAYESALINAALEAFEGTDEAEEIDVMVNREEIIEMAMDLILERQSTDGTSEE
jgi:predicted NACHT family NTPase